YDQCPGKKSHDPSARNSRGFQIYRRTNKGGQNRHRRRGKRRTFHSSSCPRKRWHPRRPPVLRDGGPARQASRSTIKPPICRSWFLLPPTYELPLDAASESEVHWKARAGTRRILRPQG